MPQDVKKLEGDGGSVEVAIHDLRRRQEEASQFSWGKGIIVGILGKVAGSYIVSEIRKPFRNKLLAEVMHDKNVQSALSRSASHGETQAIIDQAMKTAAAGMKGIKGNMLRNPLLWVIGGGVTGGLGALGLEYSFHTDNKKENEKNLRDIKTVENQWTKYVENERQNAAGKER